MKTCDYYESKLYMGSETFFSDEKFSQEEIEIFKVKATPSDIDEFMKHLAEKLLNRFNQHTICVMDSEFITMFKGNKSRKES